MSLRATISSGLEALAGQNADGTDVSWMEANWPFFSWAIFLFGAGFLTARFVFVSRDSTRDDDQYYYWYGWLSIVVYSLHQSEEHAYDLRGWRYAFVPCLNLGPIAAMFTDVCTGIDDVAACPLDPKITLYVNTVMIWVAFGGCMVAATVNPRRFLLAGAAFPWGTAVVNGIMGHIVPAITTGSYNPGVVQSVFMVPLGIFIIRASGRPLLCIVNGVISHVGLISSVKFIYHFRTNEALTVIAFTLIFSLVIPLLLSNYVCTRSQSLHVAGKKQ